MSAHCHHLRPSLVTGVGHPNQQPVLRSADVWNHRLCALLPGQFQQLDGRGEVALGGLAVPGGEELGLVGVVGSGDSGDGVEL